MTKIKVKFIRPVPSLICPFEFVKCGPFDAGEKAELPEAVGDLLIRKRRAKYVRVENPFARFEIS